MRSRRFLIGGLIVCSAVGYLGYVGFGGVATYYYTVSELLEQGSSIYGQNVRVNGQVTPGSVQQEAAGLIVRFTIVDVEGDKSLLVVYHGVVPHSFRVGGDVVVEGHLNSAGIFQAHTLMPRCPSKYVPKK